MKSPHTVIAAAIVDYHTSGLCPLDGPLHEQERTEAQHVLRKLAEAGYVIVPRSTWVKMTWTG